MPRRLLLLNVILGLVSLTFAVGIVRALMVRHPMPGVGAPRPAGAPLPSVTAATSDAGPEAYAMIAAQNPFNPGRSETASAAAVAVVKPILHGIVIDGSKSRAFLEDPSIKRVGGYSIGDAVGGGKLQKIADDRVVIARPEGLIEVLLLDPAKPRPAPTGPVVTAAPGQPQPPPGQLTPEQVRPPQGAPVQVAPMAPGAPPNQPSGIPTQSRRRLQRQQGQPADE